MHALTSSSFTTLTAKGKFVDKTPALVDFLDDDQPIHLLLRPRRSGKTTLLRAYFERTNLAEQKECQKLFVDNKLAITEDLRFETEFARYPVLYVDFSNVVGVIIDNLRLRRIEHSWMESRKNC